MEISLPYPHPGQIYVQQNKKRFNWLSAGRRWRKTTMLMSIGVEEALLGKHVLWVAPTYKQCLVCWEEARKAMQTVAKWHKQEFTADLPTGGRLIWRSMDNPDSARGLSADGIIMDEVADMKQSAWYEVLRPMLLDRGGWAWGIGTPKGRNWFFREWQDAKDRSDSMAFQAPTLGAEIVDGKLVRKPHALENPNIPFEELENMFREMPLATFRQEILAEFVEAEGVLFRNVRECGIGALADPKSNTRYFAGVDLARAKDYTVVIVMTADGEVVAFQRFNKMSWKAEIGKIVTLLKKYNNPETYVDSTGIGDPIYGDLLDAGLNVSRFHFTADKKTKLIDNLIISLEREELCYPPIEVLLEELENYEATISHTGNTRYNAPEGMHDDCVIGLALANLARKKFGISEGGSY